MRTTLRLLTILSLITLLLPKLTTAQQKIISGTVISDEKVQLPGVTVRIRENNVNTVTDASGKYTIKANPGQTLEFTYIGYLAQTVTVGDAATINVTLMPTRTGLNEVIVTAMGIKKERKALGYAVQDIKADELMKNKDPNLINSMNGKIAGLNITNSGGAPGSSASIIIRGGTSLERNNQPLFIIDGVPMNNSTGQGDNSAFDGSVNMSTTNSNRAMDINPEDVESITVLKGPAAAALYGLQAAAGAIVITTKKGSEGNTIVSVTPRYTTNWVNKLPKVQDRYKRGTSYSGTFTDQTYFSWGPEFGAGESAYDNLGDFFQTAHAYDNSFNISGGTKLSKFFLSGSNIMQTGIVPTTDYNRTSVRFNGEQQVGRFTFGVNATYAVSNTQKTLTGSGLYGGSGSGYLQSIMSWPTDDDMSVWLNPDGSKRRLLPNVALEDDIDNANWTINRSPQSDKTTRMLGNIYASVKITNWLDATYRLGIDNFVTQFTSLTSPGSAVKIAWQNGMLSETTRRYNFTSGNLMLNAHKQFKDFDFNLLLGHNTEDYYTKTGSVRAENFSIPGLISLNNADNKNRYAQDNVSQKRLVGVYGEFRASYKNFAYLGITGRNDWSSTLPVVYRSFFYPSVSGSFVFSELLPKNSVLSFGKVRASWARVGKDTDPYVTSTGLFGPELTVGGGYRNYWQQGNPELKPENTDSYEFGTELRFLGGRLGLDFTVYNNKSVNQILSPRVSNATGYILKSVNAGVIENKGIELTINANPVRNKNFNWDVTLNISKNKGRVKELPGAINILYVTDVQEGPGKAASFNKGVFMGLSGSKWATDSSGNVILDYNTGYPTISSLTTLPVGNREPDMIGGLNNSFSYKSFNFSMLWDFRLGGDVYNATEWLMTVNGLSETTLGRGSDLTFTGVSLNPSTGKYEPVTRTVKATEKYYRDVYANNAPFFIQSVNWMRLRSVALSYSLPSNVLNRIGWLKGATATISGTNLLLFTNYRGMDPEISAAGAGVTGSGSVGIDYVGVPATRGIAFGLNFKF
ncbi:TonB-linked outer membrane protein, SusC/RagA family [Chitinophaga jiangningensis]|uniref:TonB-linked outer membrane protein, SusC/RagA family n=1 Tax=Chitinophaga jiangningensis TaxID=1419482 RepID=A0A1M7C5S5_9BACT|nr:SusC/RagA family TonB-linked outer membrane protein [Chitinophaga jiangningensis]SHL62648.1 TonB-linked outer membrane protein, SusC/RagA family [Chitinophaga jiangningensis]